MNNTKELKLTTDDIIKMFTKSGNYNTIKFDGFDKVNNSENIYKQIDNNRIVCRLIRLHIKKFFDNIYIPFDYFKDDNWNIDKVIYKNKDAIFYNPSFLTHETKLYFDDVYDKYVIMIKEIFISDNLLIKYLKSWTDMTERLYKISSNTSYLKELLNNSKYKYLSPLYVTQIYVDIIKKDGSNSDKRKQIENKLDENCLVIKNICLDFKKEYNSLLNDFVFKMPLDSTSSKEFNKLFRCNIMLLIINTANKLIDNNVYAIHRIISYITDDYMMLDVINSHDPVDYNGKKIMLI